MKFYILVIVNSGVEPTEDAVQAAKEEWDKVHDITPSMFVIKYLWIS